jgi:hypothetical protein
MNNRTLSPPFRARSTPHGERRCRAGEVLVGRCLIAARFEGRRFRSTRRRTGAQKADSEIFRLTTP